MDDIHSPGYAEKKGITKDQISSTEYMLNEFGNMVITKIEAKC